MEEKCEVAEAVPYYSRQRNYNALYTTLSYIPSISRD